MSNRVVSADQLIDQLWGDHSARLRHDRFAGSRLAAAQGARRRRPVIVTRPPGYLIQLEPDQLDLHRFEHLLERPTAT